MNGTVYKRTLRSGKVSWTFEINIAKDECGRQQRIRKGGFARKAEAEAERTRVLHELNEGERLRRPQTRFGAHLQEWLEQHADQHCSPKTVERYRQLATYLLPALSDVPRDQISPLMLERLYSRLRREGGKRSGKDGRGCPLAARTVRHAASLVHASLAAAVRWGLLRTNPADACELPRVESRESRALDPRQTDAYLEAARGTSLYPLLVMGFATGCRRGELLALTWPDLEFHTDPPVVVISKSLEQTKAGLRIKTPKNGRARKLPMPRSAMEVLARHRREQQGFRDRFGTDYRTDLDLVFASPNGDYLKPDSVTAKACLVAIRAGLEGIGIHSLRHSHGSQLLSNGVPLPTVSRRLGHSNVGVTAAVYSHSFTRDEVAAAEIWDASMGSVLRGGEHARR